MTTQVDPTGQSSQSQGAEQSDSGYADNLCPACVHGVPARQTKLNQVSKLCRKHTAELNQQLAQRLNQTVGGHDV